MWWAIQLLFNYVFIAKFNSEKCFKMVSAWQSHRQKVDCLVCPVRLAMILLKYEELAIYLMMDKNCCCSCYVITQIIFDVGIYKYQTSKYISTTFLSGFVLHRSLLHSVIEHGNC